ncbi:hypothetical protein ACN9U3_03075 [Staphylococcus caprae]|uniref:hypothetical protein n=1 Tax=Staphylococcus caprae TaxID=29380 RepID=UPI003B20B843
MIYMYEPFGHTVKKTTKQHIMNLIGINSNTLTAQLRFETYNSQLRCFFTKVMPRHKKKQELNEKVKVKNECWKYNDRYKLYVSDLGRFKTAKGVFKTAHNLKGTIYVKTKNKTYRAGDIVYQTFIGNLGNNMHAYPKNSLFDDISANNLFSTTLSKYRLYRRNKGAAKPLYLVDESNNIVEEFSSTTEAQKALFTDRSNIARKCVRNAVENGLMYMWASDYKEIAI